MRNNEEEEESQPPPLPPLSQQNEEGKQEEDKTKVYEEDNKEGEDKEEEETNCNNNNESTSAPIPIARASFSSSSSSSAEDPLSHAQNTSTTIGGGGEGASPSTSPWRRWLPFQFAGQTPPPPPPPPPPLPQSLSSSSSSSPPLISTSPSSLSSSSSPSPSPSAAAATATATATASSSAITSAFYYSPLIPLPSPYAALSTSSSMMTASLMFVPQQLNGLLQGLRGYAPQAPSALTQLFWAAAAVPKEDEQMLMTEEGMPLLLSEVAWNQFLQQLNGPAAADVLQQISQFLQDFPMPPDVTLEKQGEVVQQTISKLRPTIRSHPAWKDNLPTFNADILVVDCLERYITEHLHDKLFLATEEAVAQDEALHDKIFRLQFLRPRHLSLPRSYDDVGLWDSAKEELFMMNSKRTPQEKLACLLRCSKGVLSVLRTFCSKNDLPGADDFLPALIFLILRANPPFLHSNMKYILHFRHSSRMLSEPSYYFINFLSAMSFIENIGPSVLDISPQDFQLGLQDPKAFNELMNEQDKKEQEEEDKKRKAHQQKEMDLDDYDRESESEEDDDEGEKSWVYMKKTGKCLTVSQHRLLSEPFQKHRGTQTLLSFTQNLSKKEEEEDDEKMMRILQEKNAKEMNAEEVELLMRRLQRFVVMESDNDDGEEGEQKINDQEQCSTESKETSGSEEELMNYQSTNSIDDQPPFSSDSAAEEQT